MPNHVIVSTLCWSQRPLEEAVGNIAALEFGQVDLALHEGGAHISPRELADGGASRVAQEADRLSGLIAKLGMKRVTAFNVGLGNDLGSLAEQQRRLAAVCDLAKALDVTVLTLMTAPLGTPLDVQAERLRALVPLAAERGVQLTVQTHSRQVTARVEDTLRLCELVPGLKVTLDPSHLHAGPNQGASYAALLPHTALVHLRDATTEHLQVPAGTGSVDFAWLVAELHRIEYEGKFAIKYPDRIATVVVSEGSTGIEENVLRMRDTFVGTERAQGIVRAGATPPPAPAT